MKASMLARNFGDRIRELHTAGRGTAQVAEELRAEGVEGVTRYGVREAIRILGITPHPHGGRLKVEPLAQPEDDDIESLVRRRVEAARRELSRGDEHTRTVTLPAEPVAMLVLGDPHVDNEGCDWPELVRLVEACQGVEGLYAACVGDMADNWIGRLGRLYAKSSTTAEEGWRLSEWLLRSLRWIALVGGNHDAWAHAPGNDPLRVLSQITGVACYAPDEIRLTLRWEDPALEPIVWIIRHDFAGRSWYHPTHGPNKEAMLDGRCHILTAGHIHQWGELVTEQRHGRVTRAIRVRGLKRRDSYAREKGYSEQQHGAACLLVIDPRVEGPHRVTTWWDVPAGVAYLESVREPRS
jgi:hypothetical protein